VPFLSSTSNPSSTETKYTDMYYQIFVLARPLICANGEEYYGSEGVGFLEP
jgi:hypothetical protein